MKSIGVIVFVCIVSVVFCGKSLLIQTTRDTSDRLCEKSPIAFEPDFPAENTLEVIPNEKYQTIVGFGGAFTEASAVTLDKMSDDVRHEILEKYFGDDGLHYTLCRFHINSCDFSVSSYSFDDTWWDFDLEHFSLQNGHDLKTLIPYIHEAMSISSSSIRLFGSPWSPPAWMKTNHQMDGSLHPGLNSTCHDVWARYMSRVITEYKKQGIDIWGVTIQNEPENAAAWEACCYTPEQERDFVRDTLGPRLREDHPDLKIMIYDHNKDDVATWAETLYADPEAAKFMDGTAFHWYSGPQFDNLEKAYAADPSKFLLATEACNCPGVKIDDWGRGENYGYDILGDLRHHSVGWVDWNMVLNEIGGPNHLAGYCDSPIIAFTGNNTYHIQPPYYYMGHVSKYVLPDSVVVGVKESGLMETDMSSVAVVRDDGKIVVVVMNKNDDPVPFKIKFGSEALRCNIPAHSMQTYIF